MVGICPEVRFVDLTHEVTPQRVEEGAYQLARAARWFPSGTVHLAVVDPGVGGSRRAVVVKGQRHTYVSPDNGLLTLALQRDKILGIYGIEEGPYTLPEPSSTFHGRDIFAPIAAHLARGLDPCQVGRPLRRVVSLEVPVCRGHQDHFETFVVGVDRFGNLVTAGERHEIDFEPRLVRLADREVEVFSHYGAVKSGAVLALWGSDGTIEISVNRGNAAKFLGAGFGDPVVILP